MAASAAHLLKPESHTHDPSSAGLASPTDESCNPGSSILCWAEEMGMTESGYWSGFHECLDNAQGRNKRSITPVETTVVCAHKS